ncbi:MAG: RICIN domain-containing protein, partial [Limisphaerales bacterium]
MRLQVVGQMLAGATQTAKFYGDFSNVTNVNLATYGTPAFWSDNTNALTVSGTGLVRAIAPGAAANIIATYSGLSATQNVAVTGFVTNGFVFDSFGDGFWTIANQANHNVLVANFSGASQEPFTNGATEQQFEVLYNLQNGTFRLRQHSSWFCIGALNNTPTPGGAVVLAPIFTGASAQQWYLVDAGGGYYRIFNAASNLVLQAAGGTPATVTLAAPLGSSAQLWQFTYQTHYPKKGTGGWVGQFGSSWGYDWGYGTGPALPSSCVYAPMQWGNWNVDTATYAAWHSTPKPIYLMGFNEPDNSSQANMTTSQAISLWPQLQAMNVPLVSPAMQNTFDSWAYSFFSSIAANNYRVDYSAVHW